MKLLVYQWKAYLEYDLSELCKEQGITFDTFSWRFKDKNEDEEFEEWFEESIGKGIYDAVISINYWPLLSKVCESRGLKYIAWCYDNPLNVNKIEKTLGNAVNYVFLFDRMQYLNYKKAGFDTVYHLPLGVNRKRMKKLSMTREEYEKFHAQVAFVGSLYDSYFNSILAPLDDYMKGYINALVNAQSQLYGGYFLDECITEDIIEKMNKRYLQVNPDTTFRINKAALTFAMASEITKRDRLILLNLCGKRYDTRIYSYQDSEVLKNVTKCKPIDYLCEMPQVFASSEINLNPTLRIIQTGIPLRAFDIMGAGGFLLSNYQEELAELFENEKEMVMYDSMEDAISKINFYLQHEQLRMDIAKKGKEKTLREHSLQSRIRDIFRQAAL